MLHLKRLLVYILFSLYAMKRFRFLLWLQIQRYGKKTFKYNQTRDEETSFYYETWVRQPLLPSKA